MLQSIGGACATAVHTTANDSIFGASRESHGSVPLAPILLGHGNSFFSYSDMNFARHQTRSAELESASENSSVSLAVALATTGGGVP